MFSLRRASSRLLLSSAPVYQQERQLLLSVTASTTRPHIRSISSAATLPTTIATATATTTTSAYECPTIFSLNNVTIRSKHSSTQIKRLFKKNPARRRILQKELLLNNNNNDSSEGEEATTVQNQNIIPQSQIQPVILDPNILSNGWNAQTNVEISHYPFQVARTKNKPNDAVGFLPVYSEFRKDGAKITTRIKKVSGDRDVFLNELRATLQIPLAKNTKDIDNIRIRTGGTIEVKGNRVQEVKKWLASLGF
ncbi:hypothetical protein FRACYDRAFT_259528 [Fragilariopsis cylindrus CCMP1102]|uniref:Large ribosomal subunit protein mL49 n=1 Tax=Fragilariopsis cylindrus CCMP1102 TaxID=635003 RepID=A0A1E7FQR0_9STRA|nr:hypothetical protein FRACYDRAFT_259528 [Fragilariopsis cylindrus CCMP1102]|eukprot:OEU20454.1 hypothetical protein FRACYDRAFT_259528 [Fragilariopsis cylindrus CCMP1102]